MRCGVKWALAPLLAALAALRLLAHGPPIRSGMPCARRSLRVHGVRAPPVSNADEEVAHGVRVG